MKITEKQAKVLDNLHRIVFRNRAGRKHASLDGEDCHYQLIALAAKRVIAWKLSEKPVKIAEPTGVFAPRNRWNQKDAASQTTF